MGRFPSLAGIKTNQGGIYWEEGNYVNDLREIKIEDTRKGLCFIIVGKIVQSDNPNRKPGTVCSQVIKLSGEFLETYLGNVKQFIAALLDIDNPDEYVAPLHPSGYQPGVSAPNGQPMPDTPEAATGRFWDEAMEFITSQEQPCTGTLIALNCTTIITKKENRPYTKHRWGPKIESDNVPMANPIDVEDLPF